MRIAFAFKPSFMFFGVPDPKIRQLRVFASLYIWNIASSENISVGVYIDADDLRTGCNRACSSEPKNKKKNENFKFTIVSYSIL